MRGDEADFSAFYDAAWSRAFACAYAVTGDVAAAEDVAQDAFAKAWPRWSKLRGYDDPAAWVCQVATRQAISRWRRLRTAANFLARSGPPPTAAPPDELSVALVTALRTLPEAQRRAIVLHHLGGFAVREVADVEGVPDGTIKARLSRGRAALALLLTDTPADTSANGEPSHA